MSAWTERVDTTISERRRRFDELNDTESLQRNIQACQQEIAACSGARTLRKRNTLHRRMDDLRYEIGRRLQKRKLFDQLAVDAHEAAQIAESIYRRTTIAEQHGIKTIKAAEKPPNEEIDADAHMLFEDVMLIDDGEKLQDARTLMDDVCASCGTSMERNIQLSYLVCPNLDCGMMRWYMDTSTYSSNTTYTTRTDLVKNATKGCTHYSTFLNTAQGKTSKRFQHDYLMKISFYCYVEGARKPEDVDKEMINRAQKYLGKTHYNIATILKTRLRGDQLRLPPELVKKLQLLFKALWPVFESLKSELDDKRSNMINFNFMSRVFVRLLGYDLFLPLFDKFRMDYNEIRHSAFMRRMFNEVGWVWEDGMLVDISDVQLDEYELREAEGMIDNDEEDDEEGNYTID